MARRGGHPEKCRLAFARFGLILFVGKGGSKREREREGREARESKRSRDIKHCIKDPIKCTFVALSSGLSALRSYMLIFS